MFKKIINVAHSARNGRNYNIVQHILGLTPKMKSNNRISRQRSCIWSHDIVQESLRPSMFFRAQCVRDFTLYTKININWAMIKIHIFTDALNPMESSHLRGRGRNQF